MKSVSDWHKPTSSNPHHTNKSSELTLLRKNSELFYFLHENDSHYSVDSSPLRSFVVSIASSAAPSGDSEVTIGLTVAEEVPSKVRSCRRKRTNNSISSAVRSFKNLPAALIRRRVESLRIAQNLVNLPSETFRDLLEFSKYFYRRRIL